MQIKPDSATTDRLNVETNRHTASLLANYVTGILLVIAATVLCELFRPVLLPINKMMISLVTVVLAALHTGLGPSIMVVVLTGFLHNYLYVPPRFNFDFQHKEYLATFIGLMVTGTVISSLVTKARQRAEALRLQESETSSLYRFSREFVSAMDRDAVLSAVIANIERILNLRAALFIETKGQLELVIASSGMAPDPRELQVAVKTFSTDQPTELYQPFVGTFCCYPLGTLQRCRGVLAIHLTDSCSRPFNQVRRLLEAFATQTAIALERIELVHQAELADNLRARQKLERALLNSVSHDLRTPLSTITGVLSSILEEGKRLSPTVYRELLENARDEADRLNRFVGKLLDMTRLEAGAMVLKREPSDVEDLIGCALDAMERQLAGRQVKVITPPGLPLVDLDMALMHQVMVNLLDNAVKYSPDESVIEIEACCTEETLQITVADQGPGVPEDNLPRIFDKFYRVPVPEGISGTGLGLSICHGIVEAHGGTVTAKNREGGGLAVTLALPLNPTSPIKG